MPTATTELTGGSVRQLDLADPGAETALSIAPSVTEGISGDISRDDTILPTINIVNGNGALSEKFDGGNIVLNREELLSDGETPVELTVLSLRKYYLENVEWGTDQRPRILNSMEEVAKAGGHCEWVGGEKPPFSPAADAVIVIRSSKELPNLPFEHDGHFHAVALWKLTGTAYGRAAKLIITASQWSLRTGLINGSWTLSTKSEKFGKNTVHVPVLKAGPRNPEVLVAFYKSLIS